VLDALPLFVPAIPFGLILGLAITESAMSPLVGWSSAPIIFGGAAQLTVISLLGAGSALAAVAAAIVVNARHLLYSAALAPIFQGQPRWFRWFGPYLLIDQLFALASVRRWDDPDEFREYYLAAGFTFWLLWLLTVAAGLVIGPVVPAAWNLEFAIPILFIGLIIIGLDRWPKLVAALVGGMSTYLLAGLPSHSGLMAGAVVGIVAGAVAERLAR
jgi:predicted branched-subunit amino acid permease